MNKVFLDNEALQLLRGFIYAYELLMLENKFALNVISFINLSIPKI